MEKGAVMRGRSSSVSKQQQLLVNCILRRCPPRFARQRRATVPPATAERQRAVLSP